jgi:Domain of unknown function (DU1801)
LRPVEASESQVLSGASEAMRPVVLALRSLVLAVHPTVTIVAWPRQRIISFGVGPRKMTEHYAYVAVHANHVNLGLYQGAKLQRPGLPLEGTGKNLRHVKFRTVEDARAAKVRALVRLAYNERSDACARAT